MYFNIYFKIKIVIIVNYKVQLSKKKITWLTSDTHETKTEDINMQKYWKFKLKNFKNLLK